MKKFNVIKLLAFLAAFCFFQFAYPYHLIRREQMSLFVYDWNYWLQNYGGEGWLARFLSDFIEQFFRLPVAGPVVVALLLTAIGCVTFRICRKFMGEWPSFAVAALVFVWSFMRETGNLFTTRYTIVVLGYLSLILLACQFKKVIFKFGALIVLIGFGLWALGSPVHSNYGKPWSVPKFDYERLIALDAEVAEEHWDKVIKLSRKDLYMREASYCYNLALGMTGQLGDKYFDHSQGTAYDLLLFVSGEQTVFSNCIAGEAWFHLGDMNIAEQSAITSLQASPNHTGARYLKRLARVNLITGEDAIAQKYLNILSKTLFYGRWARSVMPGCQSEATRSLLAEANSSLGVNDFVHLSDVPRSILLGLLEADPDNQLACNYLLLYDLLRYDLNTFIGEYDTYRTDGTIYQEAVLAYLSMKNNLTPETAASYGISDSQIARMNSFLRMPSRYTNTYWYYLMNAQD